MKRKLCSAVAAALIVIAIAAAGICYITKQKSEAVGEIYLYGEQHSNEAIIEMELQSWQQHYAEGVRDLFLELPYADGLLLNEWIQAEDDTILDDLFVGWNGTSGATLQSKNFFKAIKKTCPETVFHATDVGHDYNTNSGDYLARLEAEGKRDTDEYRLVKENIEQAEHYYELYTTNQKGASTYREEMMVANFQRIYGELNGTDIMGIYGQAHVDIEGKDGYNIDVPCMAAQLQEQYGDHLHTVDLTVRTTRSSRGGNTVTKTEIISTPLGNAAILHLADRFLADSEYDCARYSLMQLSDNRLEAWLNLPTTGETIIFQSSTLASYSRGTYIFVEQYITSECETAQTKYYYLTITEDSDGSFTCSEISFE